MPGLTFQLINPRLWLEAKKDSETWTLGFDAQIERQEWCLGSFKIFSGGKEYDGYHMNGKAIIEPLTSKNESQPSLLPEPNDWKVDTEVLAETPGSIRVDYLPPDEQNPEKLPPRFGILISLPADTFLRVLQANPETRIIELYVSIGTQNWREEGLGFGDDPDGNDLVWRVEKKNYAHVDFLRLTLKTRPEVALGSEPSPKGEPQETQTPRPELVTTSALERAINRLFWAVVLIGLLLILKAL